MNFIYSIVNGIFEVSPDGWASFIGSFLSFLGVFITIRYTKKQFKQEIKMSEEQFKEDKRISIKPYLDIKLKKASKDICNLGILAVNDLKNINEFEERDIGIEIANLGQGNCLECKLVKIKVDGKNIDDEHIYIGNLGNLKVYENILRKITFIIWYGDVVEEIKNKYRGKNIKDCPKEFKYFTYNHLLKKVELQFEYKDVLDNKYRKNIVIEIFVHVTILAEKYIWQVSDIQFRDIRFEINENLTTEESIK